AVAAVDVPGGQAGGENFQAGPPPLEGGPRPYRVAALPQGSPPPLPLHPPPLQVPVPFLRLFLYQFLIQLHPRHEELFCLLPSPPASRPGRGRPAPPAPARRGWPSASRRTACRSGPPPSTAPCGAVPCPVRCATTAATAGPVRRLPFAPA